MHGAGEVCKSPDRSLVNSEARTQSNTPALITKCHFSRACFISYINYYGSLHFCASQSESEPFFHSLPHQEPINSMQLQEQLVAFGPRISAALLCVYH